MYPQVGYGAANDVRIMKDTQFIPYGHSVGRKRLNKCAIFVCIMLPWAIFAGTQWLWASEVHYFHGYQACFIVSCLLFVGILFLAKAWLSKRKQAALEGEEDPTWYLFLAVACVLAWVLGLTCGMLNYSQNMAPYFHLHDLNVVQGVDPATSGGQEFLDASTIVFNNGSHVDQSLSLAFKDSTLYCVAPITVGSLPFATYDFWAVGTNCCNPFGGQFWCGGQVSNPDAHSGLRLMNENERPFYRLAVEQAEAEYKIVGRHPLFFHWVLEPTGKMEGYRHSGWKMMGIHALWYLIFQCILVYVVANSYAKQVY